MFLQANIEQVVKPPVVRYKLHSGESRLPLSARAQNKPIKKQPATFTVMVLPCILLYASNLFTFL
ncbi:hypothetical protein A4R26_28305 [Niastella populi]|uniref:Uncharacterized protein n=1 Tax=Niastella populi TaxID=550983 RepID=A0A1V9F2S0_9BACT|nr:hypothetical protein A4R26_28305 [Niastella populi]